ncbi:MAG: mechanosensitive ion channel [Aquincola sp.]|nr:mechanosensitive ion channel [Aquincola sp.]MDH4288812.1 mechanosensitive ion channel [Aquincola sp.]
MTPFDQVWDNVVAVTFERLLVHLPQLIGALALLLIGYLLARLLRVVARRGVTLLDGLIARQTTAARWRVGRSASVVGNVTYWVVLLFFVATATQTLGLQTFTDWLARLLEHIPALAAGLLIVVAGYLLSGFVADLVQATATALAPPQREALARIAQGATLVVALLVGADQVGLKITWIAIFAALVVAALLGGAALAASLGARSYVANLIGAHYLRQVLRAGQRVRIGAHEGRVIEITATSLVLETKEGRALLPGRLYHDEAIQLVVHSDGG